ncbi:hypothetical protein [Variovorax boronicumulans]
MTITAREPDPVSHRSRHDLVQAIQTPTHFLPALALSACALFISTGAQAQVKPEIANCVELKDEAIVAQAEMCSAHVGCVYVLNVQKTCAQATGYLERLQTAIGEGTRTFFGSYRKEVTPDAIFTAALGSDEHASVRSLDAIPTSQLRSQDVATKVRDVGTGDTLSGNWNGGWVYYGRTQDGKADGIGTRIFANGEIQRGQFRRGNVYGAGEILYRNGARYIGDFAGIGGNQRWGQGAYIYKNGTKQEGSFSDGEIVSGTTYRPDGKVSEKGNYDKAGKLSFGQRFDTEGVPTVVNVRLEQEAAARAAAAAEQQRKLDEQQRKLDEAQHQREAAAQAEQRRREAAAQAEQQFRASLQTLNPGQLFARADELSAQGDGARAREVQRALMSRFPNHPLAATAARQMAGESGASPAPAEPSGLAGRSTASTTASQVSLADCAPERDAVVARWRANDSTEENIKRQLANVLADVNSADRARAMKNLEQYQQIALKGSTPYPPLVFSVCMLKVRLARLAAAPSVAGDTSGGLPSTAVAASPGARGRLSGQTCEAMKQTVMATRVPPNASVTASTETVMFMTKTVLDMIAGDCPTDGTTPAQIEAERQERQRQYTAAESACNAVQSGGRRCVARAHVPSTAVAKPPVTESAEGGSSNGYDPRTGLCWGRSCYDNSPSSSGGGARTAR